MISCAPRICTGRCASCSSSRPGSGSSAAPGEPRRATAARARGARADLREIRPGRLHAPRPAARRHRRRAREAAGPGAAISGQRWRARLIEQRLRRAASTQVFAQLRGDPARGRLDRAGARGAPARAARRSSSRCCARACARMIERDLEVLHALADARAALLARGAAAAAARDRQRVPEDHPR